MINAKSTPDRLLQDALKRNEELEIRMAFLENTVEDLNTQLAALTTEFSLSKKAMLHLYSRLEQMQDNLGAGKDFHDNSPPPHY